MSSRIAVCGHAPVSTGLIRSSANTAMRRSASASSVVKMSLVTTTMLTVGANCRHSAATNAVLPLPTGPPIPIRSGRDPGAPYAHIVSSGRPSWCPWVWPSPG